MAFLAILAGHSKLPAIDSHADLRHSLERFPLGHRSGRFVPTFFRAALAGPLRRLVAKLQNAADGFDRLIDSLSDFAVGRFQRASASGRPVKLAGEPRAVAAQDVNLLSELAVGAIGLAPPLSCGLERFQRQGQAPPRGFDQVGVAHMAFRRPKSLPHVL